MTKSLICIGLFLNLSVASITWADIPVGFLGNWSAAATRPPKFANWGDLKYPAKLKVTKDGLDFEDQWGSRCESVFAFYDEELEALTFRNCLPSKAPTAWGVHYRVRVHGDNLTGEVWTHKFQFKFEGLRTKPRSAKRE